MLLEPVSLEEWEAIQGRNKRYFDALEPYFKSFDLREGEVKVLMLHSFDVERQVTFFDKSVQIDRLTERMAPLVSLARYKDHVKIMRLEKDLDETGDATLFIDIQNAVLQAQIPEGRRIVLDGIMYYFFMKKDNKTLLAKIHSPDIDTHAGRLVSRIHALLEV